MGKKVTSILREDSLSYGADWYIVRYSDGTYKEIYLEKPYKYMQDFMDTHTATKVTWRRTSYR